MRRLAHALAPDARDAADDRAWQARRLSASATIDGRYVINGSFDAQAGATIATALDALSWPDPPELRRTATQRRADALSELARRFLDRAMPASTPACGPTSPPLWTCAPILTPPRPP